MDIKAEFSQKAGPLPVWGWVIIISGGGYLAYRYYGAKKAAAATNGTGTPTTDQSLPSDTTTSPYDGPIINNYIPSSPISVLPITSVPGGGVTTPVVVPPVTKATTKIVRNKLDGAIFSQDAQGNLLYLDAPHYAALGKPPVQADIAPAFIHNTKGGGAVGKGEIDVLFDNRRQHLSGPLWDAWKKRGAKTSEVAVTDSRWKIPTSAVLSQGV